MRLIKVVVVKVVVNVLPEFGPEGGVVEHVTSELGSSDQSDKQHWISSCNTTLRYQVVH